MFCRREQGAWDPQKAWPLNLEGAGAFRLLKAGPQKYGCKYPPALPGDIYKYERRLLFLIGQQLGKSQSGVVVNGHVQGQEAGMLLFAAQPAIAASGRCSLGWLPPDP
jgi:hypothetical protein